MSHLWKIENNNVTFIKNRKYNVRLSHLVVAHLVVSHSVVSLCQSLCCFQCAGWKRQERHILIAPVAIEQLGIWNTRSNTCRLHAFAILLLGPAPLSSSPPWPHLWVATPCPSTSKDQVSSSSVDSSGVAFSSRTSAASLSMNGLPRSSFLINDSIKSRVLLSWSLGSLCSADITEVCRWMQTKNKTSTAIKHSRAERAYLTKTTRCLESRIGWPLVHPPASAAAWPCTFFPNFP